MNPSKQSALATIEDARSDCEALARHLLGEPNQHMSRRHELRFGHSGRISVRISGVHRGTWADWSNQDRGDMLDLIQRELNMGKSDALKWLRTDWFRGIEKSAISGPSRQPVLAARREAEGTDERARIHFAREIWKASGPLAGSPAEDYLTNRLAGLPIPAPVYLSGALRWNPWFRKPGSVGAMIALMTHPRSNGPIGVHATFVTAAHENLKEWHGEKLVSVRRMHGRSGIVRLWPDHSVEMFVALGEGIESTLAGVLETREAPAWAALNAGNMASFPILPGIEGLRLFVDNDAKGTGKQAADEVSLRYWQKGVLVRQYVPKQRGDFNDILLAGAA